MKWSLFTYLALSADCSFIEAINLFNTVTIGVLPLRERGADIVMIAKSLLQHYTAEAKRKSTGFSKEAVMAIERYSWPGNVRE